MAKSGQLILSRIDARNGATGIIPPDLDGAVVTNDFPLFDFEEGRVEPAFLSWLTKTRGFVDLCKQASEGTTNRVRLKVERLLKLEIPLPPLPEQRRLAARIEQIVPQIEEAVSVCNSRAEELDKLTTRAFADLFPASPKCLVGDVVTFQTGYAFRSAWFVEDGVRLARNANIGHGVLEWSDTVRLPEERRREFSRFELKLGDVLVSLDRPIISTGVKVARIRETDLPCLLLQRVARAILTESRVLGDYLFHWLRSPHFVQAIDPGRSNGVPHISHKDIEGIPFACPSIAEQRRIITESNALQAEIDALKRLRAETAEKIDALLPAVLDRAFRGEL